jgi:hypothetical protein
MPFRSCLAIIAGIVLALAGALIPDRASAQQV